MDPNYELERFEFFNRYTSSNRDGGQQNQRGHSSQRPISNLRVNPTTQFASDNSIILTNEGCHRSGWMNSVSNVGAAPCVFCGYVHNSSRRRNLDGSGDGHAKGSGTCKDDKSKSEKRDTGKDGGTDGGDDKCGGDKGGGGDKSGGDDKCGGDKGGGGDKSGGDDKYGGDKGGGGDKSGGDDNGGSDKGGGGNKGGGDDNGGSDKGGGGDKGRGDDNGGSDKGGGGDKGRGNGCGDGGSNSEGGRSGTGDSGRRRTGNGGGKSIADDPSICPDLCTTPLFFMILSLVVLFSAGIWYCYGSLSIENCLESGLMSKQTSFSACNLNANILKFFNKSTDNVKERRRCCSGKSKSSSCSGIPDHLREQYNEFKRAMRSSECLHRLSGTDCHLSNYAGSLAGARIASTKNTTEVISSTLCRCYDLGPDNFNIKGTPCEFGDPNDPCKDCRCVDRNNADVVLKEEGILIPGKCWAFSGVGELLISLFYPIIVIGVTIHHPPRAQIIHGLSTAAPKQFEVWGYNSTEDPAPHLFGNFEYRIDGSPSQIFEVQQISNELYSYVQFTFLNNHGHLNYTAVYKLEVHGLRDLTAEK